MRLFSFVFLTLGGLALAQEQRAGLRKAQVSEVPHLISARTPLSSHPPKKAEGWGHVALSSALVTYQGGFCGFDAMPCSRGNRLCSWRSP